MQTNTNPPVLLDVLTHVPSTRSKAVVTTVYPDGRTETWREADNSTEVTYS